ncbi:hypothetical protein KEM54_002229 [Ascosphaera aggregata]|nr:hypothetical protein KEM54_002229 [Ascosphaera aggregata]
MPRNYSNGTTPTTKEVMVNGEVKPYKFISRVTSYPIVSDAITYAKSSQYGQKSLELADKGYSTFFSPILPYLNTPYEYVAPYVVKADSLGYDGLVAVESRFPIVTKPTEQIKGTVKSYVLVPVQAATTRKDYLLRTFSEELQKVGSKGYIASGKAVVTTGLIVTSDTLAWLSSVIGKRKEAMANSRKH